MSWIKNIDRKWLLLGKVSFTVVFFVLVADKLLNVDLTDVRNELSSIVGVRLYLSLLIVAILMLLNICLEATKWRLLVSQFQKVTFKYALVSVLKGTAFGLVTPARLGEYAGKLSIVNQEHLGKGVFSNFLASISQNLCNLAFGLVGGLYFVNFFGGFIIELWQWLTVLLLIMLALFAYFKHKPLLGLIAGFGMTGKLLITRIGLSSFEVKARVLKFLLTWSGLRYLVYLIQYVLVLQVFSFDLSILALSAGVALVYLVQSGLPLPMVLSIASRGAIIVAVFSLANVAASKVLLASLIIWLLNLVIPAVLGLVLILLPNKTSDISGRKAA